MRLLSPQLEAFVAIVKNKTVHGAAKEIHITQTAVTQRIRTLETHLSTSLFIRSRRGMLLTSEGEALYRYCQQAEALEGEALSFITRSGHDKSVRIGIAGPSTIMHTRIIPSCINILKPYPSLLLNFMVNDNSSRVTTLRQGKCELAILENKEVADEMERKLLKPDLYVLVGAKKWKKRRLKDILKNEKIIDFNQADEMTFLYLKEYGLFDLAHKDRHFANRTSALAIMISAGAGFGVLPLEFAKPYLVNNQLSLLNSGKTYEHQYSLAWFPRHKQPDYLSALINACN